jgi:hypothetical protein
MPSIPNYALDETEEAQLNKVKRAMNNLNTINAQHLTDKPLTDPTQGKADDYLTTITREIQDVNSAVGTLTDALFLDRELITFETFKVDNVGAVKENFKRTIKGSSSIVLTIKTITKQLDELRPNFSFVALSTYTDFKTAFEELSNSLEAFTKVSTEIIEFLANNGLMNTKGYELFQTEKMIVQKVPGKKGKTKLIPSGDMNDPEFKPKITDEIVEAKIKELQQKDNYEYRFNNPKSKEYIDPNDQSDEARIKRDSLEKYYLNLALKETGVGDILEPSKYETEFDITEGRTDKDAERRLKTITILNDKIKLVSDPVAKQLKAIISSFMDLQNTYFGLIQNFNEARQQTITPAQKDVISGGNYYGGANYLSHPSAREMAAYKRSGLPEYI